MSIESSGHAGIGTDSRALKSRRGFLRLLDATRNSVDGLRAAWQHESAFRQELTTAAVLTPLAAFLPVSVVEKILLAGVLVFVLIVELLNSAIEATVDRDSLEINPLGKRAKDIGSAAVMLALLLAGATWVAVIGSHFF